MNNAGSDVDTRASRLYHRRPLLAALALVAPVAVYTFFLLTPSFETNDDVAFMLIFSGKLLALQPDLHAPCIHPMLGEVLSKLYTVVPGVPWYGLMHFSLLFVALGAVTYGAGVAGWSCQRAAYWLLCVLLLFLPIVVKLQFTRTAFMAGQAGFLLLYAWAVRDDEPTTPWLSALPVAVAVFLLAGSLCLRRESFLLDCMLSVPLLVLTCYEQWRRNRIRRWLGVLLGLAALVGALSCYGWWYYHKDAEWREWTELTALKGEFIDYRHVAYGPDTKSAFDRVGWSANDYRMLMIWGYLDRQVYSVEKMRAVCGAASTKSGRGLSFNDRVGGWLRHYSNLPTVAAACILPLAGVLILGVGGPPIVAFLATIVLEVMCLLWLASALKLPERVFWPLVAYPCWWLLFIKNDCRFPWTSARRRAVASVVGLACLAITAWVIFTQSNPVTTAGDASRAARDLNTRFKQSLSDFRSEGCGFLIAIAGWFPYECILPLENTEYLKGLELLSFGSMNQSPPVKSLLRARGVTDIFRTMAEDRTACIFLGQREQSVVAQYYLEHYQWNVRFSPAYEDRLLRAYRIEKVGREAPPRRQ